MISEEIWDAVTEADYAEAPLLLKRFSERIGLSKLRELVLGLEGTETETEEWQFLSYEDMEEEEKRVGALNWIVPNVLPEGGLVYFSAPPAGGKTWALLDLVRALTTGTKWMGYFDVPKLPVIYIDEEMGVKKIMPRLRKLGIKPTKGEFAYTNKAGVRFDTPGDVEKILKQCREMGAKLVVVDTLTRVHAMDENDNSQMKRLFKNFGPILDAGITLVVLHHDKKGGVADGQVQHERMRGASEIAASADMSFSVDKHGSYFRLKTTKGRLSAEQDDICVDFTVTDNEDRTVTTVKVLTAEERSEKVIASMEDRVMEAVEDIGPMGQTELVAAVGGKKPVVVEAANRLVAERKLVADRDGRRLVYRLPELPDL